LENRTLGKRGRGILSRKKRPRPREGKSTTRFATERETKILGGKANWSQGERKCGGGPEEGGIVVHEVPG